MSEQTLKFSNVVVNKKEFRASKQPINLNLVDTDKIVVSDKFKHSDNGYKCFIGYLRSLSFILPQMSGYIKHFGNGGKICLLKLK